MPVYSRGVWTPWHLGYELLAYVVSFDIFKTQFFHHFRYGELETSMINLVIKENRDPTESTLSASTSTDSPLASDLTPNSFHNTTQDPDIEVDDFENQFFLLKESI